MENNNYRENLNYFLRDANTLLQSNNLNEALNLAAERLRNYPADADAFGVYCEALVGMGRLEEVRKLLHDVAQIISGLNLIYERAGDACKENGFHREAANCYEKFISLRPDAGRARDIIGKMACLEQEDSPSAGLDFTDNKNISEQKIATVTMAQLYIEQGHIQDAETILEDVIEKEPHNTQAWAMLDELRGSGISQSAGESQSLKNDSLIKTLSSWLKNIERLKINAAEKSRV